MTTKAPAPASDSSQKVTISAEQLAAFEQWQRDMETRKGYNKARQAAQARLQNKYKSEFEKFLAEEKDKIK